MNNNNDNNNKKDEKELTMSNVQGFLSNLFPNMFPDTKNEEIEHFCVANFWVDGKDIGRYVAHVTFSANLNDKAVQYYALKEIEKTIEDKEKYEQLSPNCSLKQYDKHNLVSYCQRELFEICERETYRLSEISSTITVSYDEELNAIQYADVLGAVLTVRLFPEQGKEMMYYSESGEDLGEEYLCIERNGHYWEVLNEEIIMSLGLHHIAWDWCMTRYNVSVVDVVNQPLPPKADEDRWEWKNLLNSDRETIPPVPSAEELPKRLTEQENSETDN